MWCIKVFLRDFSGDLTDIFRLVYGVYEKTVSNWYHRYHLESTAILRYPLYHKIRINTRGLKKLNGVFYICLRSVSLTT